MQRNILQDIKPLTSTSRTVRQSPVSEKTYIEPAQEGPSFREPVYRNQETGVPSRKPIWIIAVVSILVLVGALSYVFAGATVRVNPKNQKLSIDDTFTAKNSSGDESLSFEVIALDDVASSDVTATGSKNVTSVSKGTVALFNETTSPQNLKIETRLSDKDGKIFKTDKAIVVPASKTVSGKKVPGSVDVGVHADVAGSEYNIPLSDFKIVGFKGSSKYDTVYGRAKTAMAGGAKGTEVSISDEDKAKLMDSLATELETKLLAKANAQIPPDFIYYKDGLFFSKEDHLAVTKTDDTHAHAELKGKISIVLFNENKLAQYLAARIPDFDRSEVTFKGLKDFDFAIKNKDQVNPKEAKEISFSLKGDGVVVWNVDTEALRNALVGKKKKDFNTTLATFSSVDTAEVNIKPMWQGSFPSNKKDINIILTPVN